MFLIFSYRSNKCELGNILILVHVLSISGLLAGASSNEYGREKRAVSCEAKYREITAGHTACLEPSNALDDTRKGVSEADKQIILDLHNTARRNVEPTATNMMLMTWDDEIANTAQRWAEHCVFEHDGNYKRYAFGRFAVGQNLATGHVNWKDAIDDWEAEKQYYTFQTFTRPTSSTGKDIGHYTQMVWAKSSKIGCGYAYCDGLGPLYVCNYGPAGNSLNKTPYVQGNKCSACPNKCIDGLCDCGGAVCLNGGTMDLNMCTCNCTRNLPFFLAPICGLNCDMNQEESWCSQYLDDDCERYTNVPQECPFKCKWCPWAAYKPSTSTTTTQKPETSSLSTDKPESSTRSTNIPEVTTTSKASTFIPSIFCAFVVVFAYIY